MIPAKLAYRTIVSEQDTGDHCDRERSGHPGNVSVITIWNPWNVPIRRIP